MKLLEVINFVDDLKPNAYSDEVKCRIINEVEGSVQTDIFLMPIDDIVVYNYNDDLEKNLLVRPPHDKLYPAYLLAMIDYYNGEFDKYQNSMLMYNAHFSEFSRWFANVYRPADRPCAYKEYILDEEDETGGGSDD